MEIGVKTEDVRLMSIDVTMGKARRELVFPVPASMTGWLEKLKAPDAPEKEGPLRYTVEGNRNIEILVTIQDLRRKF